MTASIVVLHSVLFVCRQLSDVCLVNVTLYAYSYTQDGVRCTVTWQHAVQAGEELGPSSYA